ncbi:MAG TPA: DUF1189 family protein [Candidatus Nanoarchaeia archaeon]|nr:DUF1189 family protein [Candidatus Nanoarchaeia archaeon]
MVLRLDEEDKEFLSTIWKTLLPHQYSTLSERSYRQAFAYFVSILVLGFFSMVILFLPQVAYLPSFIENNTVKLTELSIDAKIETTGPIVFTDLTPLLVIDTTGNITNVSRAKVLVTKDRIEFASFGETSKINVSEFHDIGKKPEFLKNTILMAVLLFGPGIILAAFAVSFLKYFIISSLIGIFGFLLSRVLRFHIEFKKAFLISLYSSTLMILIDLVTFPLGLNAYLLPVSFNGVFINIISFAVYLTLFIIAIFLEGHLEVRY